MDKALLLLLLFLFWLVTSKFSLTCNVIVSSWLAALTWGHY